MNTEQQYFDELAARWDELRATDAAKIERLIGMIGLQAGDRVLDVGCGTGVLVPLSGRPLVTPDGSSPSIFPPA